ncbi:MAG: NAD(P)-dependent oxidoreductase [Candidatus Bathyarchaeia archaeon]
MSLLLRALSSIVTKIFLGELVETTIFKREWIEDHSPELIKLRSRLYEQKPFCDVTLGVCLPGTWETYMLLTTLEFGGASIYYLPVFCKPEVLRQLKRSSIEIVRSIPLTKTDFIYDTDATVGRFIVRKKSKVKGIIEQTTSGVKNYIEYERKSLLKQPVIDLNGSYVKRIFENRLSTGLGLINALLNLHLFLPSKRVLIIGFGDVGQSCAFYLKCLGCKVDIYDIDRSKLSEAEKLGYNVGNLDDLLPMADIVVTATGSTKPALSDKELYMLKNGAVLANMGGAGWQRKIFKNKRVRQVGSNVLKFIRDDGTCIYELAKGCPVNLVMASGSDTETMDIVFSLGVLTMEYLVKNYESLPRRVLSVPKEIESLLVSCRSINCPIAEK